MSARCFTGLKFRWWRVFLVCLAVWVTGSSLAQTAWQAGPNLPVPTSIAAFAVSDDQLYVIGGASDASYSPSSAVWVFDGRSRTWRAAPAIPTAVMLANATALNGKVYVLGGHNGGILNVVQVLDVATGTWSLGPSLPSPRRDGAAVALNGQVYLMGGTSDGGTASRSVDALDVATGTWRSVARLPAGRSLTTATVSGGKIYVLGGFTGCAGCVHNNTWVYDPSTDAWTVQTSLPTALMGARAVTDSTGKVWLLGGSNYTTQLNTAWVFDPATGQWTAGPAMNHAWREAAVGLLSGALVVAGGANGAQLDTTDMLALAGSSGQRLTLSEAELAAIVSPLSLYGRPPLAFFDTDPLGIAGISLANGEATLSGGTLRLSPLSMGEQAYFLDFGLNSAGKFALTQVGQGAATAPLNTPLAGVDTARTVATLSGPPLRVHLAPISIGSSHFSASLALNIEGQFEVETAQPLSADAVAFLSDPTTATRSVPRATPSTGSVDDYIARQTRLDMSLPSGTAWQSAVTRCMTNGIDSLQVAGVGAKALRMIAASGPRIAEDVRFHLLSGRPEDASLVMSEWAFKALADNVSSGNELGDVLKAISSASTYGRALAAGAGACTVDYKEGLRVVLAGMANKAFPISSCFAALGMQGSLQARSWLNNAVVESVYQGWKNHGDAVFDYGSLKGIDGLIGHVAAQIRPGKNPYQITDADRSAATQTLIATFQQWQAAEASASTTRTRLEGLKARFQSDRFRQLIGNDALRRGLSEGSTASEAEVFGRYVEMMQRTRARLSALAPTSLTDQALDDATEVAVAEYVNNGASAWRNAIARNLQAWDADKFQAEPQVCVGSQGADIQNFVLSFNLPVAYKNQCFSGGGIARAVSFSREDLDNANHGLITGSGGSFTATLTNPADGSTCSGSANSASINLTCQVYVGYNGQPADPAVLRFTVTGGKPLNASGTGMAANVSAISLDTAYRVYAAGQYVMQPCTATGGNFGSGNFIELSWE